MDSMNGLFDFLKKKEEEEKPGMSKGFDFSAPEQNQSMMGQDQVNDYIRGKYQIGAPQQDNMNWAAGLAALGAGMQGQDQAKAGETARKRSEQIKKSGSLFSDKNLKKDVEHFDASKFLDSFMSERRR